MTNDGSRQPGSGPDGVQGRDSEHDDFSIPFRPERQHLDMDSLLSAVGSPGASHRTNHDQGDGTVINGYTRFELTTAEYQARDVATVVKTASEWGPYTVSEQEPRQFLMSDTDAESTFEIRVLDDRVEIAVKPGTTSDSIRQFVTRFEQHTGITWHVEKEAAPLSI